jgi:hypothetical protein
LFHLYGTSFGGVADDNAAVEQQLFDVAQAQLKVEKPAHGATDDRCREEVAVIQRLRSLDHVIYVTGPPT